MNWKAERWKSSTAHVSLVTGSSSSHQFSADTIEMQPPLFIALLMALGCRADYATNRVLSSNNQQFAAELFQEVLRSEPGNVLISPVSLQMVMGLAATGAKGLTLAEIITVLRLPQNHQDLVRSLNYIISSLKGDEYYSLNLANGLFLSNQFAINATFKNLAQRSFSAQIEQLDFKRSDETAGEINNWVSQKTNNKINNLISPSDISPDSRLVLLNAIHFKGNWMKPFDLYDTILRPFHLDDGRVENVKMMQITETFNYYDTGLYQLMEMPYEGGETSMLFILPKHRGYTQQPIPLQELLTAPLAKQLVRVQIPRFSLESTIQFKPILQKMGIRRIFGLMADLSGIGPGLYVDKVVQKTFMNVTEKGTEAAAATAGGVVTLSIPAPDKRVKQEFIADRPFAVVLHLLANEDGRRPIHPESILFTAAVLERIGEEEDFSRPLPFIAEHAFAVCLLHKDGHILFSGRLTNPIN